MNAGVVAAIIAAIAAVLGLLCTVVGVAHISGKLSQKILDNEERTQENCVRLDSAEEKLGNHAVAIGRLEEWKNGYNAAVRTGGKVGHDLQV